MRWSPPEQKAQPPSRVLGPLPVSSTAPTSGVIRAWSSARMTPDVGAVLLTGNGPSTRDGGWAFCSGGDQRIRGRSGYQYAEGETGDTVDAVRTAAHGGRLHILEVQRLI